MKPHDQQIWKSDALDALFQAFAAHAPLADKLVYKGARVLALHLSTMRQSLDIDATMTMTFGQTERDAQGAFFDHEIRQAIERYFERQDPVRYELEGLRVVAKRHPRGWNAFEVRINLVDAQKQGIKGLPQLRVDISAPEKLLADSVVDAAIGDGNTIHAYSLSRIAGEKLRAFLSTLPAYRAKMRKPGESIRVRDLYDLAKILQARPITATNFWDRVAAEFTAACESRAVDCKGLSSFMEAWDETARAYRESTILPDDVPFETAEYSLRAIVAFLESRGSFPLEYPRGY